MNEKRKISRARLSCIRGYTRKVGGRDRRKLKEISRIFPRNI